MLKKLKRKIAQQILKSEPLKESLNDLTWKKITAKSLPDIMLNKGEKGGRDQSKVFCTAQVFYQKSLAYILHKVPLNDSFWNSGNWTNYFKQASAL